MTQQRATDNDSFQPRRGGRLAAAISGTAVLALLLAACEDKTASAPAGPPPPPTVVVAEATSGSVPLYLDVIGLTAAVNQVEVRAQVDGVIQQRAFTEGDIVKEGDTLYVIDQRPYQAALEQSQAQVKQNQASLDFANVEVKRFTPLVARQDVSRERLQSLQATADEAAAALAASQAQVKTAQINLDYTTVSAPFAGRVGRAIYDQGNLITAQDTLLTNLVQLDPIYVYFSPSERQYLELESYRAKGELPVSVSLAGDEEHRTGGQLDFVNPKVDYATGTIPLRAVFDNKNYELRPGQYANVRVELTVRPDQVLVPAEAIGQNQANFFIMVVGKDNKVERRQVTLGQLYQGHRVVEQGVKPGEKVIIKGLQKVRGGSEVKPQLAQAKSPDSTKSDDAGKNQESKATDSSAEDGKAQDSGASTN